MFKIYKYRLYPTGKQIKSLIYQLDGHRFLYNQSLAQRKEIYEQTGKGVGYVFQATNLLPKLRKENENLSICNYSSLQQTLRRLDKSFKAFFRRVKAGGREFGCPRFKPVDRFNTITYATLSDGCQVKENRLYLQNIGCIKVKWHRPINGNVKSLSVTRRNDKWYVSFIVECEVNLLPVTGKEIGIDVGLKAFITTSDGKQIMPPKYLRQSERKLAKAQRLLSRRRKDSNRRRKTRVLVAKHHERITNQRLDFCHKVGYSLVQNYDGFAVENLNIKGMIKNKHLAKSISDAGWGMFLNILKDKAESAGRWYQEISPNGTSQICSSCGEVVKKSLAVRVHNCPFCGLSLDRDVNAALNILQKARIEPSWRGGAVMPLVEARSRLL
jgi:putative transposase